MTTAPFDTLKLGGMAEVIAEAVSQLATKADLVALKTHLENRMVALEQRMKIKLGGMMVVAVDVILAGFKLIH